jgi:hypothetical protein
VLGAALVSCIPLLPSANSTPRHRAIDSIVYATLLEAGGSPDAGAAEIVRYLQEGSDDVERTGGLVLAIRWWQGVREDARLDPAGVAPPGRRFHPTGPPPPPSR